MNRTFYYSEVGTAHLAVHAKKQDHGRAARLSCGGSFAVVADGHGSELYTRSSRGANLAVLAASRLLQGRDAPEDFSRAVKAAWDALVRRDLARHPPTERECKLLNENNALPETLYGTTLLAARLLDDGTAELWQLGDGEIHVLLGDGSWADPMPADENCVGNATSSMVYPAERAVRTFRRCRVENAAAVLLYTDGYVKRTERPCDAAKAFLAGDEAVLQSALCAGKRSDDLTLAILRNDRTETDEFRSGFVASMQALQLAEQYTLLLDKAQEQRVALHLIAKRLERMPLDSAGGLKERLEKKLEAFEKLLSRISKIETILKKEEEN